MDFPENPTREFIVQQLTHWRTELAFRQSGSVHYRAEEIDEARIMVKRLMEMRDAMDGRK